MPSRVQRPDRLLALWRQVSDSSSESEDLEEVRIESLDSSSSNSILLSSYVVTGSRKDHCVSLVDSGCSAFAFIDRSFVQKHNLPRFRLLRPKKLVLADGIVKGIIFEVVRAKFRIGLHEETITFLVHDISKNHPVILGFPWMQFHKPAIDYEKCGVRFNHPDCRGRCLPRDLTNEQTTAPRALTSRVSVASARLHKKAAPQPSPPPFPPPPNTFTRASTSSASGGGNPQLQEKETEELPPLENLRISSEPRTVSAPVKALLASRAGTKVQGISGTAALLVKTKNPALYEPHIRLNGKRVSAGTRRTLVRKSTEVAGDFNPNDIRELNAATFNYICEKRGLQPFVTSYTQLERLAGITETRDLDLTEEMVNNIMEGEGEQYKDSLSPGLHSFIDSLAGKAASQDERDAALIARTIVLTGNLDTDAPVCEETIRRVQLAKITEEDARKFLDKANRPDKTDEEIRAKLPSVYHDQIAAFQPGRANEMPPNRSYDHKIELRPGEHPPNARPRPMSPLEAVVVKKWIDDNLRKKFIRPSQSEAASPILLFKKPGGGVRICVDYRGINNVTMKTRYPLLLIKETLDAICKAKIFTKLDVITAFNRIRVKEGHEWLTAFITRFGL